MSEASSRANFSQLANLSSGGTGKVHLPGELLLKYRQRAGFSQEQLAQFLDLRSRRMVQGWESNDNLPRPERLQKLIELYAISGVFTAGKQHQEALLLWESVKFYSETKSQKFSIYPIFDVEWFENVLRQVNVKSDEHQNEAVKGNEIRVVYEQKVAPKPGSDDNDNDNDKNKNKNKSLAVIGGATPSNNQNTTLTTVGSAQKLQPTADFGLTIREHNPVGRQRDVEEIVKLLNPSVEQPRLLTLTGMGGIGKTTLALQAANQLLQGGQFKDGVIWVSLVTIRYPAQLLDAIALALNLTTVQDKKEQTSIFKELVTHLRDKQMLLVLDNFEQILEARTIIADLVQLTTSLKILLTSRCVLELGVEQQYQVLPLVSPDTRICASDKTPDAQQLAQIARSSAVELFVRRAKSNNIGFELNATNAVQITCICERLEGLPLAIEIAASRVKLFSLAGILQRLEHPLNFLGSKPMSSESHQRTLYSTLNWSYNLLDNAQQQLFNSFGLLIGGGSLHLLEWLANRLDLNQNGLELVAALVNHSLLTKDDEYSARLSGDSKTIALESDSLASRLIEPRFKMLEIVREFALDQLRNDGQEFEQVVLFVLEYYVEILLRAENGLRSSEQIDWLKWFNLEYPNIRFLLDNRTPYASLQAEIQSFQLKIVYLLRQFWLRTGYYTQGCEYLKQAISKANIAPILGSQHITKAIVETHLKTDKNSYSQFLDYARALQALALLLMTLGEYTKTLEYLAQCEQIYTLQNDKSLLLSVLNMSGIVSKRLGDLNEAKKIYELALKQYQELDDSRGVEMVMLNLGNVERLLGNYEAAIAYYNQALLKNEKRGDPNYRLNTLDSLGLVFLEQGDYILAKQCFEEALLLNIQVQEQAYHAMIIDNIGLVAFYQNDYERAFKYYTESSEIKQKLGIRPDIAVNLLNFAQLYISQNKLKEALPCIEESLAIAQAINSKTLIAESLYYSCLAGTKRLSNQAALQGKELVEIEKENELAYHLSQLLELQMKIGNKKAVAFSLSVLARFLMLKEQPRKAVIVFGFANRLLDEIKRKNDNADWREEYYSNILALKAQVAKEEFYNAWQEGSSASLDYVLDITDIKIGFAS